MQTTASWMDHMPVSLMCFRKCFPASQIPTVYAARKEYMVLHANNEACFP